MIGDRILELRGKEPRRTFAQKLGIGTATLQRYENNEKMPDLKVIAKIQEITKVSLDYLINGVEIVAELSVEEQLLLKYFKNMSKEQKIKLLNIVIDGANLAEKNNTLIAGSNIKIDNSFNS